jgi:putative flippase GtrA
MKFKGRPVRGAIFGFFTFLFLGLDLLFFGVIPLKSPLITILPIVGIVVGLVWAYIAPLKRRGAAA